MTHFYRKEYSRSDSAWLLTLGQKRHCWLPQQKQVLSDLALGEASCCHLLLKKQYGEVHMTELRGRLPKAKWGNHLGGSSRPSQLFRWLQPLAKNALTASPRLWARFTYESFSQILDPYELWNVVSTTKFWGNFLELLEGLNKLTDVKCLKFSTRFTE